MGKAVVKFNGGRGAILCSICNVILRKSQPHVVMAGKYAGLYITDDLITLY